MDGQADLNQPEYSHTQKAKKFAFFADPDGLPLEFYESGAIP